MSRRDEVAAGLTAVRHRIAGACAEAGRAESEVTLVVVTKTFPASDVRLLAELGVADVGENRHQDAVGKHAACAGLGLRWHFVGALQTNKAAAVTAYADVVHSVDRSRLVRALGKAAARRERAVRCLVQVSLDPTSTGAEQRGRAGADPAEVAGLAAEIAAHPSLELGGVMGVAPLDADVDADAAFARLAAVGAEMRRDHPAATAVSAGMSGDLEVAVRRGATHVRVGSAVLGARPTLG